MAPQSPGSAKALMTRLYRSAIRRECFTRSNAFDISTITTPVHVHAFGLSSQPSINRKNHSVVRGTLSSIGELAFTE